MLVVEESSHKDWYLGGGGGGKFGSFPTLHKGFVTDLIKFQSDHIRSYTKICEHHGGDGERLDLSVEFV